MRFSAVGAVSVSLAMSAACALGCASADAPGSVDAAGAVSADEVEDRAADPVGDSAAASEPDLDGVEAASDSAPADAAATPDTTLEPADALPAETVLSPNQVEGYGLDALFTCQPIPDEVFARMEGVTFPDDCPVTRDELRYLRLVHVDAQGRTKVGEMVVNEAIAEDVLEVFRELYEAGYPIERIRLACDYGGDDEVSMEDDNTSAFNCRPIEGTGSQSRHSYGMAVDVNTLYNPYVLQSSWTVLPTTAGDYVDRSVQTPYTINPDDLCCQLFAERGFTWGGDWIDPKDYQHFEK